MNNTRSNLKNLRRFAFMVLIGSFALGLISASPVQAENYGVLFSGGWNWYNNHDRYYDQTLRMWNIMTGTLGYDVSNVYVLFADGTNPAIDRSSHVNSDWSMITAAGGNIAAGTYGNLQSTLTTLQSTIGPSDCFHFWAYDHGYGGTYDQGGLCAWNETEIPDDVFASWANPINAYAESYVFGNCYSGDMINDLNILPGQNRFAAWSTGWWQSSYSGSTRGFLYEWANALENEGLRWTHDIGQYAIDHDYYGPNGLGWDTPGWTGDNFHIITNQPIPEPSTVLLFGIGFLGLGAYGYRRKKKA
jgi:hypothetical protein